MSLVKYKCLSPSTEQKAIIAVILDKKKMDLYNVYQVHDQLLINLIKQYLCIYYNNNV
jgi:hypothetical protein